MFQRLLVRFGFFGKSATVDPLNTDEDFDEVKLRTVCYSIFITYLPFGIPCQSLRNNVVSVYVRPSTHFSTGAIAK